MFTINVSVQEQIILKEGFLIRVLDEQKNDLALGSFDALTNTYILDNIDAPTRLELDATRIRAQSSRLAGPPEKISWDLDGDGVFESTGDTQYIDLNTSIVKSIVVRYDFSDTSISGEKQLLQKTERISLIATKKELDA